MMRYEYKVVAIGAHAVRPRARARRYEARRLGLPISAAPVGFVFLLACVARKGRAEELLGDAAGEYQKMVILLGPSRARWWYRVHVVKVIVPMLPGAVARLWVLHRLFGL
jgi:hypothetical protein